MTTRPATELGAADAAVRYALAGVPILPLYDVRDGRCTCGWTLCARPGKHPRTTRGVHDASTDVELVEQWWQWWPTANVGAATGQAFDVWDIDLPADVAAHLLDRYLGDLATAWPKSRTGSGGTHALVAATGHGNPGVPPPAGRGGLRLPTPTPRPRCTASARPSRRCGPTPGATTR